MNEDELRRWSVEEAGRVARDGDELLEVAAKIYDFARGDVDEQTEPPTDVDLDLEPKRTVGLFGR